MVAIIWVFTIVLGVINLTNGLSAPFITPCTANDEECIKQNTLKSIPLFTDGIPELGIETLDPVYFDLVDSSSPNLKFIISKVTVKGLKTCKPIKVQRDVANSKIHLQLSCALNLDGDYELDGQVLVLKLAGKGKLHVFVKKMDITVDLDTVEKIGKDGEKHLRVKKFKHTYELKEKSDVSFEGLFKQNDVLKKATDDLLKNSGNEVIQEIGGKMFEAALTKIVQNFNNFFGKVALKELILD